MEKQDSQTSLIQSPEDLIYKNCYAPADLREMLSSAELRSKIRRLPAPQLFFSLKELDDEEVELLLPHITEEQWSAILDLDIWVKDRLSMEAFLGWERHILAAEDPVTRKILRATDPLHWSFVFAKGLQVAARIEEDEFDGEIDDDIETLRTPDGEFLLGFPDGGEKARVLRLLILRLFQVDPDGTRELISASRLVTPSELEEGAYQNRRRRIEDLGFQDYFDAIDIYTGRGLDEALPEKDWQGPHEVSTLPVRLPDKEGGPLLLLSCLSALSPHVEAHRLIEELFFVCNKLLSADRIAPSDPKEIKKSIRKAISGINLGLDLWSSGDFPRAVDGIRKYYLVSFFQIGYQSLLEIQKEAKRLASEKYLPEGSLLANALNSMQSAYPQLVTETDEGFRRTFFESQADLEEGRRILSRISR